MALMSDAYPADETSAQLPYNFTTIDEREWTGLSERLTEKASTLPYGRGYLYNEGEQYTITKLDYDDYKAYTRRWRSIIIPMPR